MRQQRSSINQKLEIDSEFIVNAIKIGDIFFITRYLSAFVDAGAVSSCGIKEIGSGEWIKVSPNEDSFSVPIENKIQLGFLVTTLVGSLSLEDQSQPKWTFYYAYKVNHLFLLIAAFISIAFSILIFFFLDRMLKDTAKFFSEPVENLSKDLDAQKSDATGRFNPSHYFKGQTFPETDRFVNELEGLIGEINFQKDKIKEAEIHEALSRLGQQVNHDIQSPIGALRIAVDQINTDTDLAVGLIKKSVDRIQKIVSDLKIKDPSERQSLLKKEPTPLNKFVLDLVEEKRLEYGGKARIDFTGLKDDLVVEVDRTRLARALSNIINNGIEAVLNKIPLIEISLRLEPQQVAIIISDNGPGIPETIRSKIFEHGFTSGKKRGSGIGLTQAFETAKLHGGTLEVLTRYKGSKNSLSFSIEVSGL